MKQSESFRILTPHLLLTPVSRDDFEDLAKFKADPQSFSHMLGGIRTPQQTQKELEKDLSFWQENALGMFTLRLRGMDVAKKAAFVGISGVHQRPDWSGFALRFAISPSFRGKGMGREAVLSTLDFIFKAGLPSIIALVREDNLPSRRILSSVGMSPCGIFIRKQVPMWIYEAKAPLDISSLK
ncbi:GNAT family N-acetyltransferase [Acetobacteraceae bacterium]|nr:GNAT family N-acetyltransferase [Acetobacteraceae bacterium]